MTSATSTGATEVASTQNRQRWTAVAALAAFVLVAGCSSSASEPAGPAAGAQSSARTQDQADPTVAGTNEPGRHVAEFSTLAREIYHFSVLGEMVATSGAVVEGEITALVPGRTMTLPPDGKTEFSEATLRVVDILAGTAPKEIVLEEDGILAAKSEVGDRGIYFIVQKKDRPAYYRLVNSQGRYHVDDAGKLHGSNPSDELVQALEGLGYDGLKTATLEVAAAVGRGDFTPVALPTSSP